MGLRGRIRVLGGKLLRISHLIGVKLFSALSALCKGLFRAIDIIPIIFLVVAFAVAIQLGPDSTLNYLPLIIGPAIGVLWIVFFLYELFELSTKPSRRKKYGRSFFVVYVVFAYVTLAVTFAAGYLTLSKLSEGQVLAVKNKYQCTKKTADVVYYSFVTASTLGYGDLVPQGKARVLACIEVVMFLVLLGVGLMYIQAALKWRPPTVPVLEESRELEE